MAEGSDAFYETKKIISEIFDSLVNELVGFQDTVRDLLSRYSNNVIDTVSMKLKDKIVPRNVALVTIEETMADEKESTINELTSQIIDKTSKLPKIKDELLKLIDKLAEITGGVTKEAVHKLEAEKGEYLSRIRELEETIRSLNAEKGELQKRLQSVEKLLEQRNAELEEKTKKILDLTAEIGNLQGKIASLQDELSGKEESLKGVEHRISSYEDVIKKLEQERANLLKKLSEAEAELKRLEIERKRIDEIKKERDNLKAEVEKLNATIEGYKKRIASLESHVRKGKVDIDAAVMILDTFPLGKTYMRIADVGGIPLNKLSLALGYPLRETVKYVLQLKKMGLVDVDESKLYSDPSVMVTVRSR